MKEYRFKSIKIINKEEKVLIKQGDSMYQEKTEFNLKFDRDNVGEHILKLSFIDLIFDKSWIFTFFITIMIVLPVSIIVYGLMKMNNINPGKFFFITSITIGLIVWISISIPNTIKSRKKRLVEETRGKGNWKIVDDKNWDKFYRLLNIKEDSTKIINE